MLQFKILLIFFGAVWTVLSHPNSHNFKRLQREIDDGQYYPDDEGQYVPSGDEGQYHHDDSGRYVHEDVKYVHYQIDPLKYVHVQDLSPKYIHNQHKYVNKDSIYSRVDTDMQNGYQNHGKYVFVDNKELYVQTGDNADNKENAPGVYRFRTEDGSVDIEKNNGKYIHHDSGKYVHTDGNEGKYTFTKDYAVGHDGSFLPYSGGSEGNLKSIGDTYSIRSQTQNANGKNSLGLLSFYRPESSAGNQRPGTEHILDVSQKQGFLSVTGNEGRTGEVALPMFDVTRGNNNINFGSFGQTGTGGALADKTQHTDNNKNGRNGTGSFSINNAYKDQLKHFTAVSTQNLKNAFFQNTGKFFDSNDYTVKGTQNTNTHDYTNHIYQKNPLSSKNEQLDQHVVLDDGSSKVSASFNPESIFQTNTLNRSGGFSSYQIGDKQFEDKNAQVDSLETFALDKVNMLRQKTVNSSSNIPQLSTGYNNLSKLSAFNTSSNQVVYIKTANEAENSFPVLQKLGSSGSLSQTNVASRYIMENGEKSDRHVVLTFPKPGETVPNFFKIKTSGVTLATNEAEKSFPVSFTGSQNLGSKGSFDQTNVGSQYLTRNVENSNKNVAITFPKAGGIIPNFSNTKSFVTGINSNTKTNVNVNENFGNSIFPIRDDKSANLVWQNMVIGNSDTIQTLPAFSPTNNNNQLFANVMAETKNHSALISSSAIETQARQKGQSLKYSSFNTGFGYDNKVVDVCECEKWKNYINLCIKMKAVCIFNTNGQCIKDKDRFCNQMVNSMLSVLYDLP